MQTFGGTITVQMVRDAVVETIQSLIDGPWDEWTIGKIEGTWFPNPDKSDLANVYIGVVGLGRDRGNKATDTPEPERGRITRGLVATVHRIRIVMQAQVPTLPADRDAKCDELACFFQQLQDYWTKAGQTLAVTGEFPNGDGFLAQARPYAAGGAIFDPKDLGTDSLFAAWMGVDFWLVESW